VRWSPATCLFAAWHASRSTFVPESAPLRKWFLETYSIAIPSTLRCRGFTQRTTWSTVWAPGGILNGMTGWPPRISHRPPGALASSVSCTWEAWAMGATFPSTYPVGKRLAAFFENPVCQRWSSGLQ
jgi:hypothetical protein